MNQSKRQITSKKISMRNLDSDEDDMALDQDEFGEVEGTAPS
jgi:hypothetical protein